MRRFSPFSTAFASGWMTIRGARRRQSLDKGFILSDHADWNGLISSIKATGAEQVWLTHGYSATLARYLCGIGIEAMSVDTYFTGESGSSDPEQGMANPEPQESAGDS
jgi:putative mRNA 3-end processing factor